MTTGKTCLMHCNKSKSWGYCLGLYDNDIKVDYCMCILSHTYFIIFKYNNPRINQTFFAMDFTQYSVLVYKTILIVFPLYLYNNNRVYI